MLGGMTDQSTIIRDHAPAGRRSGFRRAGGRPEGRARAG